MNSSRLVATLFAIAGFAGAAQATVVDISATSDPYSGGAVTSQYLAAGTYNIRVIDNTAAGGYNGWTFATPVSGQAKPYRETFIFSVDSGANRLGYDVSTGGPTGYYTNYASTADALNAFDTATSYADFLNGAYQGSSSSMQLVLASGTNVLFSVPDNPGQYGDNTGGVSLSITAANVPEPSSVALALGGLVALTGVARRKSA